MAMNSYSGGSDDQEIHLFGCGSRNVGHMMQIALVAKALERIADHARNVSQYVVYCVQGTDIRHASVHMAQSGR